MILKLKQKCILLTRMKMYKVFVIYAIKDDKSSVIKSDQVRF